MLLPTRWSGVYYRFPRSQSLTDFLYPSFNVHGVIYVGGDGTMILILSSSKSDTPPLADVVAPIEREIRSLAAGLTSVKDEQEYIVVRERTHRNTAESTNARVKWWSVLQAIVLFSVVAWQVYYLKVSPSLIPSFNLGLNGVVPVLL